LRDGNGGENIDVCDDDHQFDKDEAFLFHLFLPYFQTQEYVNWHIEQA
jgi:hypothetical protein